MALHTSTNPNPRISCRSTNNPEYRTDDAFLRKLYQNCTKYCQTVKYLKLLNFPKSGTYAIVECRLSFVGPVRRFSWDWNYWEHWQLQVSLFPGSKIRLKLYQGISVANAAVTATNLSMERSWLGLSCSLSSSCAGWSVNRACGPRSRSAICLHT